MIKRILKFILKAIGVVVVLLVMACAGFLYHYWSSLDALDHPQQVIVYKLKGNNYTLDGMSMVPIPPSDTNMQGYEIAASKTLDKDTGLKVAAAVKDAFRFNWSWSYKMSLCIFTATYAVRVLDYGKDDFLLNDSCEQLAVYHNDQPTSFFDGQNKQKSEAVAKIMKDIFATP